MGIYNDRFTQEKIHLHFDKSVYAKGETIWFKAYLMNGNEAAVISKNLYADWYDANGKLIAHTASPVFEASAKGQFNLPENYTAGSVHVEVYTKWMLNFDTAFLFRKDIVISQPPSQKTTTVKPITSLYFFPEGGEAVNGLDAKIAFLSVNQNGDPVHISGAIKNSRNELLDSFATEHDGMGSFLVEKINAGENYTISWTDEYGKTGISSLPPIKPSGTAIQAQLVNNTVRIALKRSPDKPTVTNTLYLVAHMNQQVLYKAKINLENRTAALAELNTATYPSGVLQLTVFNALWQPVAERIVFVNNHRYRFNPSINIISSGTNKRNKNIVEVTVPDSVFSNLSVSVTDGALYTEQADIISQFLLCGDIRGKITDPAFYFNNNNDSTRHFLDLVMLTHGWRKFNWADIAQAKLPVIKYPADSVYIEIAGTVSGKAFTKSNDNEVMTLIVSAKDSSKQIIPVDLQQNGHFSRAGFIFYDTVKAYYRFKQKKQTDRVDVDLKTNILPAAAFLNASKKYSFGVFDSIQYQREVFFLEEQKRLQKLMSATTLKEVTVHSFLTPKTSLDIVNDRYTSGAFSGDAKFRADIINDPLALNYLDIFKYLESHVVGLRVAPSTPQQVAEANGPPSVDPVKLQKPASGLYDVSLRGEVPFIYINEVLSDIDALARTPMSEIAYVKVFSAPFYGAWQNGAGGAISVYTRKGNEGLTAITDPDDKVLLSGYTKYKEFYSPVYSDSTMTIAPDTRTTLYWNPYIVTDAKNHKARFEFYNNDISKKLRIVLEGMNAEGRLARVEKVIE